MTMKITTTQLKQIIAEEIASAIAGKKNLSEAMTRITPDEVEAWKSGNWAYVSGDESAPAEPVDMGMEMGSEDPNRFLHGKDGHDDEGSMVKSKLHSVKEMSKDICDTLQPTDQLPGWVQDHISVAHENLQQVHGYLMGKQHSMEHGHDMDMDHSEMPMEEPEDLNEGVFDFKAYLKG